MSRWLERWAPRRQLRRRRPSEHRCDCVGAGPVLVDAGDARTQPGCEAGSVPQRRRPPPRPSSCLPEFQRERAGKADLEAPFCESRKRLGHFHDFVYISPPRQTVPWYSSPIPSRSRVGKPRKLSHWACTPWHRSSEWRRERNTRQGQRGDARWPRVPQTPRATRFSRTDSWARSSTGAFKSSGESRGAEWGACISRPKRPSGGRWP